MAMVAVLRLITLSMMYTCQNGMTAMMIVMIMMMMVLMIMTMIVKIMMGKSQATRPKHFDVGHAGKREHIHTKSFTGPGENACSGLFQKLSTWSHDFASVVALSFVVPADH